MSNTFFIGDTHFGHRNIMQYSVGRRPFATIEEHDEALISAWNAVVKPSDEVFHLGDLFFRRETIDTVKRLNGRITLVMGNHDTYYTATMYETVVDRCVGALTYGDCVLTHIPIHPHQLKYRYKFNIHGHMHIYTIDDPQYINVSVDQLPNLAPVSWDWIEDKKKSFVRDIGV